MRPSIIFFDEIDGLAPVRSSRQDQIHSSIVSTLLALMDGLDRRGEVYRKSNQPLFLFYFYFRSLLSVPQIVWTPLIQLFAGLVDSIVNFVSIFQMHRLVVPFWTLICAIGTVVVHL